MASRRPGRYLGTLPEPVASLSLNMSPWRATATPFVPKIINMFADFWKRHAPSHVFFNLFSKKCPTVPLSLGLTHPKTCSTNLCAGKYQKLIGISHLRPTCDPKVVPKETPNRLTQSWNVFFFQNSRVLKLSRSW